jgi:two-component system probable response regulator PhcQ
MTPRKILYVDDEALALKYFARLVEPMAPVLTAASVAEGMAALAAQGAEIAVLVSDQRMPGARGNELLEHARLQYPGIVRMLTTAYSDLGEAVAAVNRGEIYRYISKPWDAESLRADLTNALELSQLRHERDALMRDKMLATGRQWLAQRMALLRVACAGTPALDAGLHAYLAAVARVGDAAPPIDWTRLDHAEWQQADSDLFVAIAAQVRAWHAAWPPEQDPAAAAALLADGLGAAARCEGESVVLAEGAAALRGLLSLPAHAPPPAAAVLLLAWFLRQQGGAQATPEGSAMRLTVQATPAAALTDDWLAADIEDLCQAP